MLGFLVFMFLFFVAMSNSFIVFTRKDGRLLNFNQSLRLSIL
jgi:hypothetical protein